jgi:pyridoxine 4-dehydrogenase
MRLTGTAAFEHGAPRDRDQSIRELRRAVELGVNHIDTAAFSFSPRLSANELINTALAPYPEHLAANVAAAVLRLSPGEMARLDSVS